MAKKTSNIINEEIKYIGENKKASLSAGLYFIS